MTARAKLGIALVILILVGGGYGLLLVEHGFSARDTPSRLEALVAICMRRMAIPSGVRDSSNPFTATPEVLAEAMQHFADHCATCHANDGSGNTEIGRNLYPKVPDMRLPATQDLTDGEIYSIIHNGIRLTGMPAWGPRKEDDEDSWKLVQFIRHLPRITAEELQEMQEWNPRSKHDLGEQEEIQRFLQGEGSPGDAQKHDH